MKYLLWFGLILLVYTLLAQPDSVILGPGVKVHTTPTQNPVAHPVPFNFHGYRITPLADFSVHAKLLSKRAYTLGKESDVSPVDFALGWQNMSDETVLAHIHITQSRRWYHWRVTHFPIPRRQIETQSANMHLIPASPFVAMQLHQIKQGQILTLQGQLVRVEDGNGWYWQSSLSRHDTGAHACELMYVTHVLVEHD